MPLRGGEAFVVLSPYTEQSTVIYGRNSHFSDDDSQSQEVLYFQPEEHSGKQKLTNVVIEGSKTFAVILSKPPGTFGAESGGNERKVCLGVTYVNNEAEDGLLGTDLVRVGLERAGSASEAVDVITQLINQYGSDVEGKEAPSFAFVICDPNEVWLLNLVGKLWAAEKIDSGYRSIPPGLSVGTKIDRSSDGLQEAVKNLGLWDGEGEFNFSKAFSDSVPPEGSWYGHEPSAEASFSIQSMFEVLRSADESKKPQSSHVSVLSAASVASQWFTATPIPRESVFKPFIFTFNARISHLTRVPEGDSVTRLHKLHAQRKWDLVGELLKSLETTCVEEVNRFLSEHPGTPNQELDDLMKDCVEAELKFYIR